MKDNQRLGCARVCRSGDNNRAQVPKTAADVEESSRCVQCTGRQDAVAKPRRTEIVPSEDILLLRSI